MNITSCNNCGVVLDKDKLIFPDDIWNSDGSINIEAAMWDCQADDYVAFTSCPVCNESILENQ